MKWNALKSYKCPKDNSPLKDIGEYHACSKCIFSINKPKFDSIVAQKYAPKQYRTEEQNLSDLNNLGRKEITEDFSDSPF
jgi:hypothetical protein